MKITWHGTATLTVESAGAKIAFDPFLRRNASLQPVDVTAVSAADAAFITHPHFDHLCDLEAFVKAGLSTVYLSEQGLKNVEKNGFSRETLDKCVLLKDGDTVLIGDMKVTVYPSVHCKLDSRNVLLSMANYRNAFKLGALWRLFRTHKKFPLDDERSTQIFEVTDGKKRLLVMGSAGLLESVEYPTGADLLVFPYQGKARMHRYAPPLIARLAPKKVMTDHFDDAFPPMSRRVKTGKLMDALAKEYPEIEAFEPSENTAYEI